MTSSRITDRDLPHVLRGIATSPYPDYIDSVLATTAQRRQRPAWTFPERWLPVDITAQTTALGRRTPVLRPILLLVILALAIVGGALLYAGSQRTELPAPFGPARNGAMFFAGTDGAIYSVDSPTGTPKAIASGSDRYNIPLPSRDGQRIAYDTDSSINDQLFVADADGSDAHLLAGSYDRLKHVDWSPDGSQLVVSSTVDGVGAATVVAVDGEGSTTLPLDREVRSAWYLPDGRLGLLASETPGGGCNEASHDGCGLFIVNADGTDLKALLSADSFGGLGAVPSPDGRSLLYVRWTTGEEGRLYIVDIETGQQRAVPIQSDGAYAINRAYYSPDGSRILFDHFEEGGVHWAVVLVSGGSPIHLGPTYPDNEETGAAWSPDGQSVLAYYPTVTGTDKLRLLDPTSSGEGQPLGLPVTSVPAWQRLAP